MVPALLLCYFIPGRLNTFGVIDGETSRLYPMARDYLLPMALVLLTLACDLGAIARLGPKAIILFLTGNTGIIIGAPVALAIMGVFDPSLLNPEGPNAIWRGMSTTAGAFGLLLSFTRAKKLEGAGASKVGTVAIYVLVATIGMQMNLAAIFSEPELFVLGLIWISPARRTARPPAPATSARPRPGGSGGARTYSFAAPAAAAARRCRPGRTVRRRARPA